ncbi:rab family small GTPase [Reticulomyxa filosa]|uniref:Rab family small GTPase n=1 Tax=Reticulomyxa filosa TaxID=46433 RepID=X6LL76_RETFI|nr:rab family small GTPase [Reticulomyxa filosa]|eukprot:ETO02136.1 rab family small GTPase [Reticulomyxa filosa]
MKTVDVDGKTVKLQIWDTAGQDRFRAVTTAYYRGAMGIVLVYDITQEQSFLNVRNWVESIREHAADDIPVVLVGNKCDKIEDRVFLFLFLIFIFIFLFLSKEEGKKMADEYLMRFYETSAKHDINVKDMFINLARDILIRNQIKVLHIRFFFCKVHMCFVACTFVDWEELHKQAKEKGTKIKDAPAKLELAHAKKKCNCS